MWDKKREASAYMVTDYEGAKGPRALGPLFLEDGSFHLSFSASSLPPLVPFSSLSSALLDSDSFVSYTAPTAIPNYLCPRKSVSLSPFASLL